MTSEPYHKVGRGGAGNFYSQQDIDAAKLEAVKDLEKQPTSPLAKLDDRSLPDYAHTGRGGAGNWVAAPELRESEVYTARTIPLDAIAPAATPKSKPTEYYGRGGAGNIVKGDEEKRRKANEEKMIDARRRREAEVVRDVEMGLKPPEKAYLGTGAEKLEEENV